jgi:hypothetical protein
VLQNKSARACVGAIELKTGFFSTRGSKSALRSMSPRRPNSRDANAE